MHVLAVESEEQREALHEACSEVVETYARAVRDDSDDECFDLLSDARALQARLQQDASCVSVPPGLVPELREAIALFIERTAMGIVDGRHESPGVAFEAIAELAQLGHMLDEQG